MAKSSNYTIDRNYWYCADFETITPRTEYYNKYKDTKVILSSLQKYNNKDTSFINHTSISQFMNYLFNLGHSSTIFFHNLSFDGDFIIKYLVNQTDFKLDDFKNSNNNIEVFKNGNVIYSISLSLRRTFNGKQKKIKIIFRCSQRLLNASIENLGKDLKINKYASELTKDFYDYEPFESIDKVPKDYLEYCNNDVSIMNKALSNFEKSIESTERIAVYKRNKTFNVFHSLTVGSLAMSIYKCIYLPRFNYLYSTKIKFKIDRLTYELTSPFYSGGFTQFNEKFLGQPKEVKNGKFYDVKSAYPFQMTKPLPYGDILLEKPKGASIEFLNINVGSAKIKKEHTDFVILRNWKLGEGRYTRELKNFTCYYFPEEWKIINKIYDIKIKSISSFYMKTAHFMSEFIQDMYFYKENFKLKGQLSFSHAFKILINASYGKLATREKYNSLFFTYDIFLRGQIITKDKKQYEVKAQSIMNPYGDINAYICRPEADKKHLSNIAAAGYITALQRAYLFNAVFKAGTKKFIYSDTDSVALENPDEKKIKIGRGLGDWELEKEFTHFGTYGAKKYLCYNNSKLIKAAMSGVNINQFKDQNNNWKEDAFKSFNFNETNFEIVDATLEKIYLKSGIALFDKTKQFKKGTL